MISEQCNAIRQKPPHTEKLIKSIRLQTGALMIIAFAVVLFLLVQAQFLLVSLATAIVLFSLTRDVINFIARQQMGPFRIPNWLASIAALLLISAVLLTLTSIILAQVNTVLSTTLAYTERAPFAVASLFSGWARISSLDPERVAHRRGLGLPAHRCRAGGHLCRPRC